MSAALREWKALQEGFKGRRILAPGGINFAASQFVFAGYSGAPFSNRAFKLRLRAACRALGVGEITEHGLRHSAATILLNYVGKDSRYFYFDDGDRQEIAVRRGGYNRLGYAIQLRLP